MSCFVCQCIFPSNSELLRHIRLSHPASTVFRCNEDSCRRGFSLFNSFRKHRHRTHFLASTPSSSLTVPNNFPSVSSLEGTIDQYNDSNSTSKIDSKNFDFQSQCASNELGDDSIAEVLHALDNSDCSSRTSDDEEPDLIVPSNSVTPSISTDTLTEKLCKYLMEQASHFVSKLYNLSDLPRKRVQFIVEEVTNLANGSAAYVVRDHVLSRLKALNENPENLSEITALFDKLANPFKNFETEYFRFKYFISSGNLILPEQVLLGQRNEYREENGVQKLIHIPVTAEFVPIRQVFKKFFEMPNVFRDTMNYLQRLHENSDIISNFVQGSFWKEKMSAFENKIVLPLFLYFDDYENNNPLGSHAGIGKCGAVYLSIPCLPAEYQSKLENIFLFILFNTIDRKVFKNKIIFSRAIDELKFLRAQGITVSTPIGNIHMYFELALILGDNLGMHGMLGFVECFRANFPCRFCLVHRDQINSTFDERSCALRDICNYDYGLTLNDVSRTGIVEECVFHELGNFHSTRNRSVDPMHDLGEGICPRDVSKVLHYFVCVVKLFTLEELNSRINGFHYSFHDKSNKPPEITLARLKSGSLSMSSSEMFIFVRNLPLIIGDLVPEGNIHWQIIIQLKAIIEIILSKAHQPTTHDYLETLITEYLTLVSELFPNSLTPKHHFLLHYPRINAQMGPLWKLASMRYESKHREGKITSHVSISRVNVCRTIAIKHQLQLNHRLMNYVPYAEYAHGLTRNVLLTKLPNYADFCPALPLNISQDVNVTEWIEFSGQRLKTNSVLVSASKTGPKFFIIKTIFLEKENQVVLVAKTLEQCFFDVHYQAYKVIPTDEDSWCCTTWSQFRYAFRISHIVATNNSSSYVIKNWY